MVGWSVEGTASLTVRRAVAMTNEQSVELLEYATLYPTKTTEGSKERGIGINLKFSRCTVVCYFVGQISHDDKPSEATDDLFSKIRDP